MEQSQVRAQAAQGHVECHPHQVAVVPDTERSADDDARKEVQDRCEEQLTAAFTLQLRRVADPGTFGLARRELRREKVRGDRLTEAAACGRLEPLLPPRPEVFSLRISRITRFRLTRMASSPKSSRMHGLPCRR
jgi:hypothetical protein